MKLRYTAIASDGRRIHGVIDAKDVAEAAGYLRSKDLLPIHIQKNETMSLGTFFPMFRKTKASDVILFTRQLSQMLTAGLTLLKALEILKTQTNNTVMTQAINGIIGDIEDGGTFSSAISKYPDIFSGIYVSLIKAAEASGLLDKVLQRLADNLEKDQKLKSTIKQAFLYPIIVLIMMVLVVFIMMIFVIPQLDSLYQSLNVQLPLPTRIVVGLSHFTTAYWPVVIGGFFLFTFVYTRWHKTAAGKIIMDTVSLKLPIFGKLMQKKILAEFARTLSLLIGTGTLVVPALEESAATTGNTQYEMAIKDIADRVEKGVHLGDAMRSYPIFPMLLVELVQIGEQTGKLDETLMKASEYFEEQVDALVKGLTTALEPIIMVVLGVAVAFLIISVITPIYSLTNSIK